MHLFGSKDKDGGTFTACGVYSPPARREGPRHMVYPLRMTESRGDVTCKRCQKSPAFKSNKEATDAL